MQIMQYYYGDPQSGNWDLLKSTNGGDNWIAWATVQLPQAVAGIMECLYLEQMYGSALIQRGFCLIHLIWVLTGLTKLHQQQISI